MNEEALSLSIAKVRVGIIGYGLSGKIFHAPLLKANEGYEIVKVLTTREEVETDLPGVAIAYSAEEIFEDYTIDLVVICTPTESHYSLARAALQSGKHVVVEKPFVVTSAEAKDLIELAREEELILSVFQNRRWDSDFLTLQECMSQGLLGEIHTYKAHFDRYRPEVTQRWKEHSLSGGGVLYDLGSHLIDQALILFGIPLTVWADVQSQRAGSTAPDYFHIIFGYETGLRVELSAGSLVIQPGPKLEVHGLKGSFRKFGLDTQEEQLKAGMTPTDERWGLEEEGNFAEVTTIIDPVSGEQETFPVPSIAGNYDRFYDEVYDAVIDGAALPVHPTEALEVIHAIELAIKSSNEKRVIQWFDEVVY